MRYRVYHEVVTYVDIDDEKIKDLDNTGIVNLVLDEYGEKLWRSEDIPDVTAIENEEDVDIYNEP